MKPLLPALLLLLAAAPAQAEIFKWVDEKGRTHFGETLPEKYRKSATTLTPQPLNTINGNTLRGPGGSDDDRSAAPAESPPADVPPVQSEKELCEARHLKFQQSQECFARYRNANGSLKVEASQNCENVEQPSPCD